MIAACGHLAQGLGEGQGLAVPGRAVFVRGLIADREDKIETGRVQGLEDG